MPYFPPSGVLDGIPTPTRFNEFLKGDPTGISFDLPPFLDAYVSNLKVTNMRVFIQQQNSVRPGTQNGTVTFYPTTDGTASGNALFSAIAFAYATPFTGSNSASNGTHLCGGRSISGDLKTVSFNVAKGAVTVLGGAGLQAGDANTPCMCIIVGVPV